LVSKFLTFFFTKSTEKFKISHFHLLTFIIVVLKKNVARPPAYGMGGGAPASNPFSNFMNSMGGAPSGPPNPLMGMDPFSADYQKALEEKIKQDNITENANYAQEYNPELYSHITMLYIECGINGHEIQAFVDSGAQSTIMSNKCAEKCNLMKLLDKRFQGIAQGVGTSKILGRIHAAQIQIGSVFFTTSLTILEDNKIDMLFGLDNLKRHKCSIDLNKNQLTLNAGEVSVPFLKDHEIERDFVEEAKEAMINVDSNANKSDTNKIEELMMMGYDEHDCKNALDQANGNIQLAATILASRGN